MEKYFIILYVIMITICYIYNKENYIPLVILFIFYAIFSEENTLELCNLKLKQIVVSLFLLLFFYVLLHLKCNEYVSLLLIITILIIFNNYLKINK